MQNIVDALQKFNVKKTAVERSLASLVEKASVTKKEYGKAKIFIASQQSIKLPDPDEVKSLDEKIATLTTQSEELTQNLNGHRCRISDLASQLTLTQAKEQVAKLEQDLQRKEKKLKSLGDGSALMSKEDKQKLELSYYKVRTTWKKYKRMVTDITEQISEGMGTKPKDLYEQIGIETDEEMKMQLADFPEITNPAKRNAVHKMRGGKRMRQT